MFYYLHYYQKSIASDLNALVGTSSLIQHGSKGDDTRVREETIKTGLGVAFKVRNLASAALKPSMLVFYAHSTPRSLFYTRRMSISFFSSPSDTPQRYNFPAVSSHIRMIISEISSRSKATPHVRRNALLSCFSRKRPHAHTWSPASLLGR